jgi:hypothetical protein
VERTIGTELNHRKSSREVFKSELQIPEGASGFDSEQSSPKSSATPRTPGTPRNIESTDSTDSEFIEIISKLPGDSPGKPIRNRRSDVHTTLPTPTDKLGAPRFRRRTAPSPAFRPDESGNGVEMGFEQLLEMEEFRLSQKQGTPKVLENSVKEPVRKRSHIPRKSHDTTSVRGTKKNHNDGYNLFIKNTTYTGGNHSPHGGIDSSADESGDHSTKSKKKPRHKHKNKKKEIHSKDILDNMGTDLVQLVQEFFPNDWVNLPNPEKAYLKKDILTCLFHKPNVTVASEPIVEKARPEPIVSKTKPEPIVSKTKPDPIPEAIASARFRTESSTDHHRRNGSSRKLESLHIDHDIKEERRYPTPSSVKYRTETFNPRQKEPDTIQSARNRESISGTNASRTQTEISMTTKPLRLGPITLKKGSRIIEPREDKTRMVTESNIV